MAKLSINVNDDYIDQMTEALIGSEGAKITVLVQMRAEGGLHEFLPEVSHAWFFDLAPRGEGETVVRLAKRLLSGCLIAFTRGWFFAKSTQVRKDAVAEIPVPAHNIPDDMADLDEAV